MDSVWWTRVKPYVWASSGEHFHPITVVLQMLNSYPGNSFTRFFIYAE